MTRASNFLVLRIYFWIVRDLFLSILGISKIKRDNKQVISEYGPSWEKSRGKTLEKNFKYQPMFLDGKPVMLRRIDYIKFAIKKLSQEISEMKPESVLELGSGDGLITLSLAVLRPEVRSFKGIDLTPSGVKTANYNVSHFPADVLSFITDISPDAVYERLESKDIQFIQGDMRKLPFGDNSFDFSFSRLAIGQIPNSYLEVFKEARRVSRKGAVFLEEFREAQKNYFQLMHLRNRDFFRASYKEVEKAGFRVKKFEPLSLGKIEFTIGMLVCGRE